MSSSLAGSNYRESCHRKLNYPEKVLISFRNIVHLGLLIVDGLELCRVLVASSYVAAFLYVTK